MNTTYTATVYREDGYWIADVDGVPGGATETRSLARLDAEVRDLLAGLLDIDEDAVTITYDYSPALGDRAADRRLLALSTRAAAQRARHDYETAQEDAVNDLRAAGASLRDTAALLDISFQRVQQLERHPAHH